MNRRFRTILIAVTLLLAFACFAGTASACPTCKDGMAGDPAMSSMVNGYFWSILFMMSMPFLTLGGISAYFYYEVCRARKRQSLEALTAESSTDPEIALQS
jgi:di/tricarboxylate transporter